MGMTITEKICARAAGKDRVGPGDMIDAEIDKLYIKDLRFSKTEDPKRPIRPVQRNSEGHGDSQGVGSRQGHHQFR